VGDPHFMHSTKTKKTNGKRRRRRRRRRRECIFLNVFATINFVINLQSFYTIFNLTLVLKKSFTFALLTYKGPGFKHYLHGGFLVPF
jgi:hypothetical protein